VGLAGGGGLVRLAWDLLTPKLHPNTGIHMRLEVASIWLHPALYDLAQDPSQAAACQSLKELRRYAKERGLEKCFYIITSRSIETSGDVEMLPTIREPCSMTDDTFSEFVNVMAAAAGRPPPYANTDFSTAKVGVIPDRLRRADPHEVLDELNVREQLPNQEAKEKTGIALRKAIVR